MVLELFIYNGVIADEKGHDNSTTLHFLVNQKFYRKMTTDGRWSTMASACDHEKCCIWLMIRDDMSIRRTYHNMIYGWLILFCSPRLWTSLEQTTVVHLCSLQLDCGLATPADLSICPVKLDCGPPMSWLIISCWSTSRGCRFPSYWSCSPSLSHSWWHRSVSVSWAGFK